MRICYQCAWCGEKFAAVEVARLDEAKFGFDCLTSEEREDIINIDAHAETMRVKSLCDRCVAAADRSRAEFSAGRTKKQLH